MKRLTQITDYCTVFCRMEDRKECAYWTGCVEMKCGDARIYDRLAAYENTGMEPEEVKRCKLTLMGKSLAEITEFEGISIERLKELAIAEKEGRLVVLPEVAKALAVALMQVFAFEEAERALEGVNGDAG